MSDLTPQNYPLRQFYPRSAMSELYTVIRTIEFQSRMLARKKIKVMTYRYRRLG
jgi:hypothetical protein